MSPIEEKFNHWSEKIKDEDRLQELQERLVEYERSCENLNEGLEKSRLAKAIERLKQEIAQIEKLKN